MKSVMSTANARAIPEVVQQHADESASLCNTRSALVASAGVKLHQLRRIDERLVAHLDGLEIAGEYGAALCDAALADPGFGEAFAAAALAFGNRDAERIERMLRLAEALAHVRDAVIFAASWVSPELLRGVTRELLDSPGAVRRQIAIAACDFHMVDPGDALAAAIVDVDASLRAQALRAAGDCGRQDLASECVRALTDEDPDCRFWAAHSAVLLGERHASVRPLHDATLRPGPHRAQAFSLLFMLANSVQVAPLFKALLDKPEGLRDAIRGAGTVGDPQVVPWLIAQMHDPRLARLAGEALCMITGWDLAELELERNPPRDIDLGPDDNPEDDDIAMDEDEGLPWPDPEKVQAWWDANGHDYPVGQRYFMGAPPSWAHCLQVLKSADQRQRAAAAQYLCLLRPGSRLFSTSAPAWRQQQWLNQMET